MRRLLCVGLTAAVMHLGISASAPPHAHEAGDAHALAAIDLHSGGTHHPHGDQGDDHEPGSMGSESVLHIHVAPQFTPVEIAAHRVPAVLITALPWPEPSVGPGKGRFNPPLRPPRAIL